MNNIIQTIQHTARAAAVLLLSVLTTMTAWADDAVTYIDMDGKTKTVTEYTEVTTDMTADGNGYINWSSGTYVVKSSVTLNGCIRFRYPAVIDLIVCDGATLTSTATTTAPSTATRSTSTPKATARAWVWSMSKSIPYATI